MKILASVFEAIEAHTPYGGVSVSYEPVGSAWLKLGARRRRERSEPGGVRVVEVVTAETRSDPRLIAGRVLRFGGADWRIQATETVGGRAILMLERSR
jgi:hypothetical protein